MEDKNNDKGQKRLQEENGILANVRADAALILYIFLLTDFSRQKQLFIKSVWMSVNNWYSMVPNGLSNTSSKEVFICYMYSIFWFVKISCCGS